MPISARHSIEEAAAIGAREISSLELTTHVLRLIDAFQPKLNAHVYLLREQAQDAARKSVRSRCPRSYNGFTTWSSCQRQGKLCRRGIAVYLGHPGAQTF